MSLHHTAANHTSVVYTTSEPRESLLGERVRRRYLMDDVPRVIVLGYDGLPCAEPDEAPMEDQPLPADASPVLSPITGYVPVSDQRRRPEEDA
ncbi:hypothetical protein Tco_1134190 [Tanacetum coccineum]